MDKIVFQYDQEASARVNRLKYIELGLLGLTLLVLALEARFVFQPMVGRIGQALGAVRASEERLRSILDSAPVGMALLGTHGEIVERNAALQHMFADQDDLRGRLFHDATRLRDLPAVTQLYEQVGHAGTPRVESEQWFARRDNTPLLGRLSLSPVQSSDPQNQHIVAVLDDLTERQQIERTLHTLSTPLLQISRATVLLPLVGEVDARRTQQLTRTLLDGIAAQRVRFVILDITGAAEIDAHVADTLVQIAQAARLLGAGHPDRHSRNGSAGVGCARHAAVRCDRDWQFAGWNPVCDGARARQ